MSEDPLLHGPEDGLIAQVLVNPPLSRLVERDRGGVIDRRDDGSVIVEVEVEAPEPSDLGCLVWEITL